MSNCRLQRFESFRDRRSRYIVFFGSSSAITREPLKVRRQVKHWQKGFYEIFQMYPTKKECLHLTFLTKSTFFGPFWESFWSLSGKNYHADISTFWSVFRLQLLARIITNHQYQKKPLPLVLWWKLGRKKRISRIFEKKRFFVVLRQNRCRYWILECTIGKNAKNTTKTVETFWKSFVNFMLTLCQIFVNFSAIFFELILS